jgi:hypothetical protein
MNGSFSRRVALITVASGGIGSSRAFPGGASRGREQDISHDSTTYNVFPVCLS